MSNLGNFDSLASQPEGGKISENTVNFPYIHMHMPTLEYANDNYKAW